MQENFSRNPDSRNHKRYTASYIYPYVQLIFLSFSWMSQIFLPRTLKSTFINSLDIRSSSWLLHLIHPLLPASICTINNNNNNNNKVFNSSGIFISFWCLVLRALLQFGRSLVQSQLVSLEFLIDIKSFRSRYGPGVDSASNRNKYQEHFLGIKAAGP